MEGEEETIPWVKGPTNRYPTSPTVQSFYTPRGDPPSPLSSVQELGRPSRPLLPPKPHLSLSGSKRTPRLVSVRSVYSDSSHRVRDYPYRDGGCSVTRTKEPEVNWCRLESKDGKLG